MEEIPLETTEIIRQIKAVLDSPPPEGVTWPDVTGNEFVRFHTMDRYLFTRLVLLIQRNPKESMYFMAFWMYLEREYNDFNLVTAIINAPTRLVCDLAEETKLCICCVENEDFLFAGEELLFVRNFTGGLVTYRLLHDHRLEVIEGVNRMLNGVCRRAFDDILHRIYTDSDQVLGFPAPPAVDPDEPAIVLPRTLSPSPPPPRSTLPHTAPPFIPAAAAATAGSSSSLAASAPPFVPAALAAASALPHNAQPFFPAARVAAPPRLPELIRIGSGPPSSEGGLLGSSPANPFHLGNSHSNLLQMIRSEELNNAVAGQLQFLGSNVVPRPLQPAPVMGYPSVAIGVPAQMNQVVMGHPIGQWVPYPPMMPTNYAAVPQQQLLLPPPPVEPMAANDELLRAYLGNMMNFLEDEPAPEMEHYSVESRTMFLTFSKGYPISEAEVYEFFTRTFGDVIESIHMQPVLENEQVLFAKIVARSPAAVDAVVHGGKAKYTINGKHIMVRKFVRKPIGESRSGGADGAGPSGA